MKKFKCVASRTAPGKAGKKVKNQRVYQSHAFTFLAKDFKDALLVAERIAKKMICFESLKVSEV